MYKRYLILFMVLLLSLPLFVIANQSINDEDDDVIDEVSKQVDHSMRYTSMQFTQPESEESQDFIQNASLDGYTKVAENDKLILYVEEKSLAIKIENKETGYIWASGLDEPDNYRLNTTWKHIVQSAITIDYKDRQEKKKTESILTNDSTPEIEFIDNGFTAKVFFYQSKITVQIDVKLAGEGLVVSVPQSEIVEDKYNKLISMEIYPFFGAVNEDDIPGYLFIPDGSGALVRFESNKKGVTPYVGPIYGRDEGIQSRRAVNEDVVPVEQITMPVFGMVHGAKQNGFIAIVEDGYAHGDIVSYTAGASTDFNRVSFQHNYRYQYYQPTSRSMDGLNMYQKEMNNNDIKLRYAFLNNEDADYVGMAKKYQEYLIDHNMLQKQEDHVDIRLEFLGGEMKEGLFWDSVVPMTEINRVPDFVGELRNNGVEDMFVIYKGWSKGGFTGSLPGKFPIEKSLGSKTEVINTIESLSKNDTPIYFYTDYTTAYEGSSGFSGNRDAAKKVSSEVISQKGKKFTTYSLSPSKAFSIAKKDVEKYQDYGIKNLAIDQTGFNLFSDFSKDGQLKRTETIEEYLNLFNHLKENVGPVALYRPNVYAWKATDRYFDIPMYSSNYVFETDTVPFIQIVLKGYLPYYAPFSNFNSNPDDQILRMIEYGAYPSFLLTEESSSLLAKTPSSNIYSSEFSIWKDDIIQQYEIVKDALSQVEAATIESRTVLKSGVVEVSYSNGKTIIVNYTNSDVNVDGMNVDPKSYVVIDKGGEQ